MISFLLPCTNRTSKEGKVISSEKETLLSLAIMRLAVPRNFAVIIYSEYCSSQMNLTLKRESERMR